MYVPFQNMALKEIAFININNMKNQYIMLTILFMYIVKTITFRQAPPVVD